MSGLYCFVGSNLEKCGKLWKNGVFPGGYGQIGEIPHGWISPDWDL